jgi:hypothetical protein
MSGGDDRVKAADKWAHARSANLAWGRPPARYGRWAPPFAGRLLVSSRSFLSQCRRGIFILTSVCLFGEYDSGPDAIFLSKPSAIYKSPKLVEFISLNPYSM